MARIKLKQKCKVCKAVWISVKFREYPICVDCQMKQVLGEEITNKKYKFLNIDAEDYKKSRFLRNIRVSYNRYKELTENQTTAFKKVVKELKNPDYSEDED